MASQDSCTDPVAIETNLIRSKLHTLMNITEEEASITLFPSGSDAELLPTCVGLVRSYTVAKSLNESTTSDQSHPLLPEVDIIIVAGGEVGSGTSKAASGRHFSNTATFPQYESVCDGGLISGLDNNQAHIKVIEFKGRDQHGCVKFRESEIVTTVTARLTETPHRVAVVHLVCGSKTGLIYPSIDTVVSLQRDFGSRVLVVVDACQLRCHLSQLRAYVCASLSAMVLITGRTLFF